MDIKVRNLPAKTVASLDELAAKSALSREEYIRIHPAIVGSPHHVN